jgi:RNA polymerase sigma-70 factor, ECF subfamily
VLSRLESGWLSHSRHIGRMCRTFVVMKLLFQEWQLCHSKHEWTVDCDQISDASKLVGFGQLMGEQETFADCIVQHLPYLKRMVRGLTRNDPMTDDIVQEIMLKALLHAGEFRFESTLKTWLTSIAKNELRQFYRCKWRTCSVPLVAEDLDSERSPQVDSPRPSYQATERDALIRQAVSRLPESYRSVVELCDLQRLPLQEVAERLQLTVAAAKTRRQRARKKLRPLVAKLKILDDSH